METCVASHFTVRVGREREGATPLAKRMETLIVFERPSNYQKKRLESRQDAIPTVFASVTHDLCNS